MKNKKVTFSIILFSLTAFLYSGEISSFAFEGGFGLLNGKIIENVWNAHVKEQDTKITYTPTTRLSRLDWQIENSPFYSAGFTALFNRHLQLDFSFTNAINRNCGVMEDYDWEKVGQPDHLTKYSIHINYLQNFTDLSASLGYAFLLDSKFPISIIPHLGIKTFSFNFWGRGGYKMYEEDGWEKIFWPSNTIVIEYSQAYAAPELSLTADFEFNKYFQTILTLRTNYIMKYDAFDSHKERSKYFNDQIESAWVFRFELKPLFKISSHNKIGIKASLEYMSDALGFTYSHKGENTKYSSFPDANVLGGTSRFLWQIGLIYSFYL